ncbi:hypothetical protein CSQ93_24845 [Janthinobacterium sp. BJB426]|uniref:hypothetical protein n=1 Tax=Janthinobacterium sp. BJB426 TaxID=2048010 RepID=UPI000C0F36F7|nr:hypothetical protein [Janthinobacterium sp. BJB426]PHV25344.1 hypothetical protein CSQ93_24845 [Janthinobacterium sp. BJB426]
MEQFHFLVGEFKKNSPFIPAAASEQLFSWFEQVGERVDRYGSKTGKVVKFSQKNYEKTLFAVDADSIELFSPRIVPPGDVDEWANCDALALYSHSSSLMLAIHASKLPLAQLFHSAEGIPGLLDHCDYVYGYSETLGYGTGYARGYLTPDAAHPWIASARSDPGNNWGAIKRKGLQYEHIRDVYPISIFSQSRLDALPPERQQALRKAMQAYGSSNTHDGKTHWILSGEEQAAARSDLQACTMLGSLIDN